MVIYLLIFAGLKDLRFCTRILDEINYSCDGSSVVQTEAGEAYGLDKVALTHVESVTVEHENQVQVSINKVMSYLKQVYFAFGIKYTIMLNLGQFFLTNT